MSTGAGCWVADAEPVGRLGREGGSRMVLEGVEEAEEDAQPGVPGLDAPAYVAGCLDDLTGDVDKSGPEGAELHGEQSASLLFVLRFPGRVTCS